MALLALELTSDLNSIALLSNEAEIRSDEWETEHLRRQQAFHRTPDLLARAGISMTDIHAIAVGTGPGSYFGLRVAYSYAHGLAFPHSLTVTGATSSEIMAWNWFSSGNKGSVACVHDIRRGHLALAIFNSSSQLILDGTPHFRVLEHGELASALPDGVTVCTPDWTRLAALLSGIHGHNIVTTPRSVQPTAHGLLELIQARTNAGMTMTPVTPLYLHPPVAVKSNRTVSA